MVRELKHDGDTGIYVASESEEGTLQAGVPAISRKNRPPQPD